MLGHARRLTLFALVFLAVACGGGQQPGTPSGEGGAAPPGTESPAAAPNLPDACEMLSNEDITEVLNAIPSWPETSVEVSERESFPTSTSCSWTDGPSLFDVYEGSRFDSEAQYDRDVTGAPCEPVSGLGEKAQFCFVGAQGAFLTWLESDLAMRLVMIFPDADVAREPMRQMAERVQVPA